MRNYHCTNDGNINESSNNNSSSFKIRERSVIDNHNNREIEEIKSVIACTSSHHVSEIDNTDSIDSCYLFSSGKRSNRQLNSSWYENSNIDDCETL